MDSLKQDVIYEVQSDLIVLGYVLNREFYGTHWSERGPINLDLDSKFEVIDQMMKPIDGSIGSAYPLVERPEITLTRDELLAKLNLGLQKA